MKKIYTLLSFSLILLFSNCATIIHGSRQTMVITCEPRVADVFLDGSQIGQTPLTTHLTRAHNHKIRVSLDGYMPYEVDLKRRLDGWIFGNVLIGGLIGIGIDAATGSMFHLTPKDIYPELKLRAAAGTTSGPGAAGSVSMGAASGTASTGDISIVLLSGSDLHGEKIGQLQRSSLADR